MVDNDVAWVVGGGGLLGRAILRQAGFRGETTFASRVSWSVPADARAHLVADAEFLAARYRAVRLYWCAGAGVVGTSPADLDAELEGLKRFLDGLADVWSRHPRTPLTFFFASSAGGVYAGSEAAPFTEETPPVPLTPYGSAKLAAEQLIAEFAQSVGANLLIGRISNLYGPGQNLGKPQGLVSQLCRSQLQRQPLMIYVPLDTIRDYVYVDDAAEVILAATRLADADTAGVATKIIASGRATTLASILGELRRVTKQRPLVVLGRSPSSVAQSVDLRFRSTVLPQLDNLVRTPLPAGILATYRSVAAELAAPR